MTDALISQATPDDADDIAALLAHLGADIGKPGAYRSTADTLRRHGFGPAALFHSQLARQDGAAVGLVLYFPHFSTMRGLPGVYVQDLWTAPDTRGTGLARRLLAAAAAHGAAAWGAGYMMLTVDAPNHTARAVYDRLGFTPQPEDRPLSLDGDAFDTLCGQVWTGEISQ